MLSAKKRKGKNFYNNKRVHKELLNLLTISAAIFLLILSLLNLQKYMSLPKVLGAKVEYDMTEIQEQKEYWEEFLSKNPTYYDGWQQLYQINLMLGNEKEADKAFKIFKRIDFNR